MNVRTPPLQDRVTSPSLRLVRRLQAALSPPAHRVPAQARSPEGFRGQAGPPGRVADDLTDRPVENPRGLAGA